MTDTIFFQDTPGNPRKDSLCKGSQSHQCYIIIIIIIIIITIIIIIIIIIIIDTSTYLHVLICFVCVAKRLALCEEVSLSKCGDVLFHGYLNPPGIKC